VIVDDLIALFRERLVKKAREQVGGHYLMGGKGTIPDDPDSNPYVSQSLRMHPNDPNPHKPIMFAAELRGVTGHGHCVCAGRWKSVLGRKKGDPKNKEDLEFPRHLLWLRPCGHINNAVTYGENCAGVRHFDCMGFINWCIAELTEKWPDYSIPYIESKTGFFKPVRFNDLANGDLVLRPASGADHIGFVAIVGLSKWVIHAKNMGEGVVEEYLVETEWGAFRRLPCERLLAGK
jgi:cell wall-associated NlpC family hydrolase